jgi:hypothetical protein
METLINEFDPAYVTWIYVRALSLEQMREISKQVIKNTPYLIPDQDLEEIGGHIGYLMKYLLDTEHDIRKLRINERLWIKKAFEYASITCFLSFSDCYIENDLIVALNLATQNENGTTIEQI